MSQQNTPAELPASSELTASSEIPLKRKRGRPRKENTSPQQEHIFKTPASERMKQIQDGIVESEDEAENKMVGQTISGVLDGKFDGGYLLTVRLENDDTLLRGVVFKPEHAHPITPSNDVAPNVTMHRRSEIPFPDPDIHSNQMNFIVQQILQSDKLPVQLEKQELTVKDQSAFVAHLGLDTNMKQGGCSSSMITEAAKIYTVGYKDPLTEPPSEPRVMGIETIDLVSTDRGRPMDCITDLNELKSPTKSHVVVQCNTSPLPEVVSMQIDIPTESCASLQNSTQQEMKSDVAFNVSSVPFEVKNDLSLTNFPIAADIPSGSYTSPKKSTEQGIQSDIALKISSGDIVAVDMNDSSSPSELKNEPSVMNFPVAADIPSGSCPSPKKSTQRETEPDIALEISSGQLLAGDTNDTSLPSQVQGSSALPAMNIDATTEKSEQQVIEPKDDSSSPSEMKNNASGTNTEAAVEESEERVTEPQSSNYGLPSK